MRYWYAFSKNCDIGILEFNKCLQFAKVPSIVHAYLKPLIQKRYQWKLNPEKSSITKIGHSCGYATSMIWTSDAVENKHDVYRGKDCMKKIWESLRNYTMKIIKAEEKVMVPLTNKECKSYLSQKNLLHF